MSRPKILMGTGRVITLDKSDSLKDIKIKLAPVLNHIADKHDIPMMIDQNGDDVITDWDRYLELDGYEDERYD